MEKMKLWMLSAILFCSMGCLTSFAARAGSDGTDADEAPKSSLFALFEAINCYLADSIGGQYSSGEVCIPCYAIIAANGDPEGDGLLAWGDYWVYNFNIVGDTLKAVSGGNHPGLMHLKTVGDGLKVIAFDQASDGAKFEESAKAIFGEYYDGFCAYANDPYQRDKIRESFIAEYVKAHNLSVKYYQDYGWPAKEIKEGGFKSGN